MKQGSKPLTFANILGSLGYISVLFQWLWSFLILIYPLLIAQPDFLFPTPVQPQLPQEMPSDQISPLLVVLAFAATIAILIITAVVLFRLPKTIGKKGAHITRSAASTVVPVVTQHKKLTRRRRVQLSYRIILILKACLVVIPLIALLFAQPIDRVDSEVVWAMALFCAICSSVYFLTQHLVARIMRVAVESLW
ncbi:MAG: hypothetical protein WBP12_03555 [Candidatus Saccharimonas sp.]